jgi:uncharacterized protein YutE (UPF0331/DUF86 family)
MVDPDVVARRLLSLREALDALGRREAGDAAALAADVVLRAAVERWLQVAIESCIDIASHVVSDEGWTPVDSGRAAFLSLASHGRISMDLAQRLARASAMRNVLVHDYVDIDLAILARTVREDLADLRAFGAAAGEWLASAAPT